MRKGDRDIASFRTTSLMAGGELLTASFREQRFCRHWHETYVVAVVLEGAQGYWYRGAQRVSPTGMVIVINPGEVHTGESAIPGRWSYRAFYPAVEWLRSLAATVAAAPVTCAWFPDDPLADATLSRQLVDAHLLIDRNRDALEAETALHTAFASLLLQHANPRPPLRPIGPDAARVQRMRYRLGDDLTEAITLETLASSVGLSPFHALRLFTRMMGIAPHAWRNQLRISHAVTLLRRGTTIADAATAVGFYDQSHFTRHFRRVYGVPPGAFTKAIRSRAQERTSHSSRESRSLTSQWQR